MIELFGGDGSEEADVLAVPVFKDLHWGPGAGEAAEAMGNGLAGFLDQDDFSGKAGQIAVVPAPGGSAWGSLALVGVGEGPDAEDLRKAAGSLGRRVSGASSVSTTLHQVEAAGAARAVAEGFVLGQYRFDKYQSEPKPVKTERLLFIGPGPSDLADGERGIMVAAAVAFARDLINEPPVYKTPADLAAAAADMAARLGLRVEVHDEHEIVSEGFGGLAAVNAGAANPARMVELWHEPEGADAFLAFVGKGIVFDSGGLSLKPAEAMENMKTDVSGGAAVLGAMQAVAELGLGVKVVGIVPFTENLPGGAAMRPGDVLTARNGKTIEVLNTDAEGRLVLADALALAAEDEPDVIVDVATLTGACKVALGEEIGGLFSNDDKAKARTLAAAEVAGERLWELPLPPDYRQKIDSEVADMKNTGTKWGGAITAALLLEEFVDERPWVHLDIAGPARSAADEGYVTKGGTGFGVRTLVALAEATAQG